MSAHTHGPGTDAGTAAGIHAHEHTGKDPGTCCRSHRPRHTAKRRHTHPCAHGTGHGDPRTCQTNTLSDPTRLPSHTHNPMSWANRNCIGARFSPRAHSVQMTGEERPLRTKRYLGNHFRMLHTCESSLLSLGGSHFRCRIIGPN